MGGLQARAQPDGAQLPTASEAGCCRRDVPCCAALPQRLLTSGNPVSNFPAGRRKPHGCSFAIRWSPDTALTPPEPVAKLPRAVPGKHRRSGVLGGREEGLSPSLSQAAPGCGEGTGPHVGSPLRGQPGCLGPEPLRATCGVRGPPGPGSGRFGDVFTPFPSSPPPCFVSPQSFGWARRGWRGHLCPAEKGETMEKGVTRERTRERTIKRGHCANRRRRRAAFGGWGGGGCPHPGPPACPPCRQALHPVPQGRAVCPCPQPPAPCLLTGRQLSASFYNPRRGALPPVPVTSPHWCHVAGARPRRGRRRVKRMARARPCPWLWVPPTPPIATLPNLAASGPPPPPSACQPALVQHLRMLLLLEIS